MNEEMNVNEAVTEADELKEMLAEANRENEYLKRRCICSEMGVPAEMAEDIIHLGEYYSEKDGTCFEEAARTAFGRIGNGRITTGIMTDRRNNGNDALRKAFGLK